VRGPAQDIPLLAVDSATKYLFAHLRDTGWCRYSLLLHSDGLLAGYAEADLTVARAAMATTDVVGGRGTHLHRARRPARRGLLLEEVSHLEDQPAAHERTNR
jgi:hypothetical protein